MAMEGIVLMEFWKVHNIWLQNRTEKNDIAFAKLLFFADKTTNFYLFCIYDLVIKFQFALF